MNAIKSPATKKGYENSVRRYLNHIKKSQMEDLLEYRENPRYIESQIIDYIMSLRNAGVSYSTIKFLIATMALIRFWPQLKLSESPLPVFFCFTDWSVLVSLSSV